MWNKINWKNINLKVYDLQYKIFCCARNNKINLIRYYQKKLVESEEAKLLATRLVTQDNREKVTAGIDGIKKLTSIQRFHLSKKLIMDGKVSKIRRIFISKGSNKPRPLNILTIEDRAKQMLVKLALEPEWEARFEINFYGFRPGYSAADAKWCIARQLQGGPKYFLNANIEACFDNIDHTYLLKKLNTSRMFSNQIKAWLEVGIMHDIEKKSIDINESGTLQSRVLSPLLMNIALHGMENTVVDKFGRNKVKVIRYADDFVIFAKTLEDIKKTEEIVSAFLKPIGLNLAKDKT